jgi:hypothetical protein
MNDYKCFLYERKQELPVKREKIFNFIYHQEMEINIRVKEHFALETSQLMQYKVLVMFGHLKSPQRQRGMV